MLTKGMCVDWAKCEIHVNAIGPGYFKTELNKTPVESSGFSGRPLGGVFLASKASSFINGHVLYVDDGITSAL